MRLDDWATSTAREAAPPAPGAGLPRALPSLPLAGAGGRDPRTLRRARTPSAGLSGLPCPTARARQAQHAQSGDASEKHNEKQDLRRGKM